MGDAYQLNPHVFTDLQRYTGCTIDRFATAANRLLPTFNSYFHEPGCNGVDAFAQTNWQDHINFCNPPFGMIGKLIKFLHTHRPPYPPTIVIAPRWYQQPWFQRLTQVADEILVLPSRPDLFTQVAGAVASGPYLKNPTWVVCAFIINVRTRGHPPFPRLQTREDRQELATRHLPHRS